MTSEIQISGKVKQKYICPLMIEKGLKQVLYHSYLGSDCLYNFIRNTEVLTLTHEPDRFSLSVQARRVKCRGHYNYSFALILKF